ncbi:MAG: DUF697 domain-containing protein [Alphaproteobacteria bacterium]|nr:MAG: DUF697 domain-containing protein [Alphaproteobacteria bacterium]
MTTPTEDPLHKALADARDFTGLLAGCRRREAADMVALVRQHRPDLVSDPRLEEAPDRWPDLIAAAISAWVADVAGSGTPLDLARHAVTRLGGRPDAKTDLHQLDKALLALPDASDEALVTLARTIARLRHRKTWPWRLWQRWTTSARPAASLSPAAPVVVPPVVAAALPTTTAPLPLSPDPGATPLPEGDSGGWMQKVGGWLKGAVDAVPLSPWTGAITSERASLGRINLLVLGGTAAERHDLLAACLVAECVPAADRGGVLQLRPEPPGEADLMRVLAGDASQWHPDPEAMPALAWLLLPTSATPDITRVISDLDQRQVPWIGLTAEDRVVWHPPSARRVLRVQTTERLVEGIRFAPVGLEALIDASDKVLPEDRRAAFDAVQRVDIARRTERALAVVKKLALSAGGSGALPIPVADVATVFAVQVKMVIATSLRMGVRMESNSLKPIAISMVGALASTAAGRFAASQVLKLIPGVGSLVGGAVSGTVAAATTYALGRAYVEYLRRFHADTGRMPGVQEIADGFQSFWARWGNKEEVPDGVPPPTPSPGSAPRP